jgi:hypothetical protein
MAAGSGGMNKIITREMTITHREFFRLLPGAVKDLDCQIRDNIIDIRDNNRNIMIVLGNESTRDIASLTLPVTCLTFDFTGYSEGETEAFLKRFDLLYQKGGG